MATCLISVRDVIRGDLDINLVVMTPITSAGNHSDLEHMCGLNRFIYSYVVMPKTNSSTFLFNQIGSKDQE